MSWILAGNIRGPWGTATQWWIHGEGGGVGPLSPPLTIRCWRIRLFSCRVIRVFGSRGLGCEDDSPLSVIGGGSWKSKGVSWYESRIGVSKINLDSKNQGPKALGERILRGLPSEDDWYFSWQYL